MSPSFFEFHHPWVLLLAVPAVMLLVWRFRRKKSLSAIVFPTVARLKGLRPTWRQRFLWVVPALEVLAVLGLIVALARPREGDAKTIIQNQGIAIQMVLDRSGSMAPSTDDDRRTDGKMLYRSRPTPKIDIVKDVFLRFIQGDDRLAGRSTDLIGLTTFARYPQASCPLVPRHEPLVAAVKNLTTVAPALDRYDQPVWKVPLDPRRQQQLGLKQNPLNATAIGDAIRHSVASLVTAEEDLLGGEDEGGYKIQGKVLILLTDGENNSGMDPEEAARYAKANDVRIYYILLQETVDRQETIFGTRVVREREPEKLLEDPRKVAESTGGKAYLAADGDELLEIYQDIDKIERTDLGKIEFKSYHEKYRLFLIPALCLAFLALLLKETTFRSIP